MTPVLDWYFAKRENCYEIIEAATLFSLFLSLSFALLLFTLCGQGRSSRRCFLLFYWKSSRRLVEYMVRTKISSYKAYFYKIFRSKECVAWRTSKLFHVIITRIYRDNSNKSQSSRLYHYTFRIILYDSCINESIINLPRMAINL